MSRGLVSVDDGVGEADAEVVAGLVGSAVADGVAEAWFPEPEHPASKINAAVGTSRIANRMGNVYQISTQDRLA